MSDKVAGIIKDLTIKNGIQEIALTSAANRIEELLDEIERLKEQLKA